MKVGTYVELTICDYNAFDESHPYRGIVVPSAENRECVAVQWFGYSDYVYHYPMSRLKVLSTVPVS